MKLLFTTDLHGVKWKYDQIYELAKSLKVDVIINAGDMLPMKPNFFKQDDFIKSYLDSYFLRLDAEEILYLCFLGNDDLRIFDDLFESTCNKYAFIKNLTQKTFKVRNLEFIGFNWIPDLPFGLKDRCRKDNKDFKFPKQIGKAILSNPSGLKEIDDWFSYANTLPTIKDELDQLARPIFMENAIYIIHSPPSRLDLDVLNDGQKVGSEAVYNFLKENQPLISFHGHVHESPNISKKWYSNLGRTLCIQPGQSEIYENFLIYVIIDLGDSNMIEFEKYKISRTSL